MRCGPYPPWVCITKRPYDRLPSYGRIELGCYMIYFFGGTGIKIDVLALYAS
jgi:hypothetical protein